MFFSIPQSKRPIHRRNLETVSRRQFLAASAAQTAALVAALGPWSGVLKAAAGPATTGFLEPGAAAEWLRRWENNIVRDARNRYCEKELAEELGWLVSPFLEGFYYGYLATGEVKWVEMLVDWADGWIRRGIREPDGFIGWPKPEAAGTEVDTLNAFDADSLLGEAMCLRVLVLMAGRMQKDEALKAKYSAQAAAYLKLAEATYEKWDVRGAWRETARGGIWVVLPFGLDRATNRWTEGYATRHAPGHGFSHPNNKANHDARWHLAMYDVTGKAVYRERAEKWFRLLKSRLKTRDGGKYFVWNYWEPGGPWDYKPNGAPKHWVGVHPNGGYYEIDVRGIVDAFEHQIVFTREDIDRLIATNRDYMWNQKVQGAEFRRIDGEPPVDNWKKTPGVLWSALLPYDATLREVFAANHNPGSWGGLSATPWYLSLKA